MNKLVVATILVIMLGIGGALAHDCTVQITPPSPQTLCPGTQQTFSCQGADAPTATVTWKLGAATVATGTGLATFTVTYDQLTSATRTYTCTVTVSSECTQTANLVVNKGPSITVTVSPPQQAVCGAQVATFTCSSPGATVQFRRVGGAFVGSPATSVVTLQLTAANIGQQYECVATSGGCTQVSTQVQVVAGVVPVPIISPSLTQTVCGTQVATFTCTATGAIVQFRRVGGAFVGSPAPNSVTLQLTTANIGQQYECVATLAGCQGQSDVVQVTQGTLATPTISSSVTAVCFPLSCATLTCTSSVPGVTYTFFRGGTAIATNQVSNTLEVCPSTTTSYSCSVTNAAGCVSSQSGTVTIQSSNVASGCQAGNSPPHKINICHFPGQKGNDKSQCIAIEGFINGHCPHHPTDYATSSSTCGATAPNPACTCEAILAART